MRNKLAGNTIIFSLCMSLFAPAGYSRAEGLNVRVTLPDFAVKLNGHTVENQYREYPLLVYHDITYVPMTWYDSGMLGLEANWSPNEGLNIKQSPVTSSYFPYASQNRNATAYTAEAPASTVTINGKVIDNTEEEYPLLSFRDVTYFPLTWRFAGDEFGWDYRWDATDGLSITSHNPQVQTVNLPASAGENDVALFNGYYYFVETTDGTTNHVFRASVQHPSDKEEIYSYKLPMGYNGLIRSMTFQIRDDKLWFTYHVGEGVMGHDEYVKIGEDGKAKLSQLGHQYKDFRDTPYGTLIVDLGAGDVKLSLLPPGQEATSAKPVGDPELTFAHHVVKSGLKTATTVVGDDVYVLCSRDWKQNFIYRINLQTNKTEKLVNSSVSWFRIIDNKLLYVKVEDDSLYSSALDGSGETKLSDHAVSWFDGINGNIFYTTEKQSNQHELYRANPNGEDPLVWTTPVADVRVQNERLVCRFGENNDGIVLLDASGRLLLKALDPILRVLTSDNGVLLESSRDSTIIFVR